MFNNHPDRVLTARPAALLAAFGALVIIAFVSANAAMAQSLSWDNSLGNPYVSSGNGRECTAFAWGRFKAVNGDKLRFVNPQGRTAYPSAGLMFDYAVESSTVYRDNVPVRGGLISWRKPNEDGHVGNVERVNSDGSVDMSEQNWPTGSGPIARTLTAAKLQNRPSTVNGKTSYYTLAGYVNPNRETAIGTMSLTKLSSSLQAKFTLMDEDRRDVYLLLGIEADGQTVSGTSIGKTVPSNGLVTANFTDLRKLRRGRTYTVHVWARDFRGLRSTKTKTFTW